MTIAEFIDKYKPRLIESGENAGKIAISSNNGNKEEIATFIKIFRPEIIAELNRRETIKKEETAIRYASVTEHSISIFGNEFTYHALYEVENAIKQLQALKVGIAEKTFIDTTNCDITWNTYIHVLDAERFSKILNDSVTQTVNAEGLESVFDVDPEATANRNEGLTGDYYRVGFFKPEFQADIIEKCDKYITAMGTWLDEMTAEAKSIIAEEKAYRELWEEVKVHEHVSPKGGEMGTDGYHDATYRRKSDGAEVRVISRDIFDVGKYTMLAREKTASADNNTRSEAEKSCLGWLHRYPVFGRDVRMWNSSDEKPLKKRKQQNERE